MGKHGRRRTDFFAIKETEQLLETHYVPAASPFPRRDEARSSPPSPSSGTTHQRKPPHHPPTPLSFPSHSHSPQRPRPPLHAGPSKRSLPSPPTASESFAQHTVRPPIRTHSRNLAPSPSSRNSQQRPCLGRASREGAARRRRHEWIGECSRSVDCGYWRRVGSR
jgi:hypothetical protein